MSNRLSSGLLILCSLFVFTTVSCTKEEKEVPVESISMAQDTAEMTEGETLQLKAVIMPQNATNKEIIWTSSNMSVATVSSDGTVTALTEGSTTIYASAESKKAQCLVVVKAKIIPVTSVSLDKNTLELTVGATGTITATVSPDNATDKTVSWSSSDESTVTVSDGKISALKLGKATVTVKTNDGEKSASCTVTVIPTEVTSVELDKTSASLKAGEKVTIKATVKPDDATDKTVTWSSSDESVATVSDGEITAVKVGNATITAKAGEKSAECTVTVIPTEVTSVELDKTSASLKVGEKVTIKATVKPDDATDKTVTWSSSDESVATVSDGEITAVKVGNATITAKAGEKSAECNVTVQAIAVESVSISQSSLEMVTGESRTLTATVLPQNATDKSVVWKSSNEQIAVVSEGKVTAKNQGDATISVETNDGHFRAECSLCVKQKITNLQLSMDSFMGSLGASYSIKANITPEDAASDITWTSSNSSIARVSGKGKEATINISSSYYTNYATIKAYDNISGKSASIKVCNIVTDFTWSESTGKTYAGYPLVTIAVGEKYQLKYSCSPWPLNNVFGNLSNFVFYEPTYVVTSPTNLSIDNNGVVTGLKTGTTGIKATGAVVKKSGGIDRVYIKVVDCYEEEEPNNDFPYATAIKANMPMKFKLSSTTDVDVFKFDNPVSTSGNEGFKIKLTYDGDGSSTIKSVRWEMYDSNYTLFGSGTLSFKPAGETNEVSGWLDTTSGFLKFYFPTDRYNYPSMLPSGTLRVEVSK